KWRTMAAHKLLGSRSNRAWGMDQAASHRLFDMVDIPASSTHWFHLRVVKAEDEQATQYNGDFYGLELGFEEFDKNFLEAHGLEAGNLYKLITGQAANPLDLQRYQAPNAVDDGSDFNGIIDPRDRNSNRNGLSSRRTDEELRRLVNWDKWNWYHVVVDAVRHYDVSSGDTPNSNEHLKNRAYYFEPVEGSGIGRLVLLPWDTDTTWGPNWNGGVEWAKSAIWNNRAGFTRPQFKLDFENVVREFRDLIWTEEQIGTLLDGLAAQIEAFVPADRDRWTRATSTPGTGSETSPTLESVVVTMKDFAFNADGRRNSYTGGTWTGGAFSRESMDSGLSGREGRDAYLDWLGQDPAIPVTPTVAYTGEAGFPQGGLAFSSSAFADPQGAGTFGAMEFRVAEVKDELGGAELEWNAEWESGELAELVGEVEVPAADVRVGRTYRARVRHCDDTGRWSHWSEPLEFVVSAPSIDAYVNGLMVSELMYHPVGPTEAELAMNPTWDGDDFEFIEILNVGDVALDLSDVRFTKGVEFDFVNAVRTSVAAGERVVLVGREAAFNARYGFAETPGFVIGEFSKSLANGGENVRLAFGAGTVIREFAYGDATPWPEAADGAGSSLVLVSPGGRPDHALPESWRASAVVGGTPGEDETGGGFVGDPLADGDGDGEVALVEYATGGSDADGVVLRAEVVGVSGETVEFAVPRNQLATDVNFVFEVSADLESWTAATFVGYAAPNVATYEAPLGDGKLYGRTRVELP
ncbi:MAG: CotH kinase family protein, partial [Verrucomicrobiales bacterium]|nr:CotH kinase family protein [Verrucomicrobiales bacterium]